MAYVETDGAINLGGTTAGNGGYGFGGEGWWVIILFALIFGWGRGGYGGYGGSGDGVMNNYVLGSDFSMLSRQLSDSTAMTERKLDGIANGICDSTFALNNTIVNGNNAIQSTLTQGFAGLNTGMVQQGYENRIAIGNVGTQLAQCCCDLKEQIANVNYNMATNTCSIIQSGKDNTQRIVDLLTAQSIEAKNDKIAAQQAEISALRLKASQEAQNNYLVNTLRPTPQPCYVTCNPYGCNCNGCGCTSIQ